LHIFRESNVCYFTLYHILNNIFFFFFYRCNPLLSSRNCKLRTYTNWKYGTYKAREICRLTSDGCYKFVHMTKNKIWIRDEKFLSAFNRAEDGTLTKNVDIDISNEEITDLVVTDHCNDVIISGHRWEFIYKSYIIYSFPFIFLIENSLFPENYCSDGSIRCSEIKSLENRKYLHQLNRFNVHDDAIFCLDATPHHIISSGDNSGDDSGGVIKVRLINCNNAYVNVWCWERDYNTL